MLILEIIILYPDIFNRIVRFFCLFVFVNLQIQKNIFFTSAWEELMILVLPEKKKLSCKKRYRTEEKKRRGKLKHLAASHL